MAEALKFTEDHLWVRIEGNRAHLGISEYGQVELGEVIAVELPDVGDEVEKGEPFGEIESVRTVSELLAPLSGTIVATNNELDDHPAIVNEDPYHEGWLVEIELGGEAERGGLVDGDEEGGYAAGGEGSRGVRRGRPLRGGRRDRDTSPSGPARPTWRGASRPRQ